MKQLTCPFSVLWALAMLFSVVSVQGMEKKIEHQESVGDVLDTWRLSLNKLASKMQAFQAEEYNKNNPLFLLVNDTLNLIASRDNDQVKLFEDSIKTFMKISTVCKHFNKLLTFEVIGEFCKDYPQDDKDWVLARLWRNMGIFRTYEEKRLPILILMYAKADYETYKSELFESAVGKKDIVLTKILLDRGVDPNQEGPCGYPLFFDASIEIALLLINKGVNVHALDSHENNILHRIVRHEGYSSELITFYLSQKVNARQFDPWDNACLLHDLARPIFEEIDEIADFLKKGMILLNAIPDMVNALDVNGKTPIDIAERGLKSAQRCKGGTPHAYEQLIALYREHGGLTAQELLENLDAIDAHITQANIQSH